MPRLVSAVEVSRTSTGARDQYAHVYKTCASMLEHGCKRCMIGEELKPRLSAHSQPNTLKKGRLPYYAAYP